MSDVDTVERPRPRAPRIKGGTVLGHRVETPRRELDVFDLPAAVGDVEYSSDEVTSVCPITGQPDFYVVTIRLERAQVGIESKSLKLYLQSFRDEGQFCEQFAHRIASDVHEATGAEKVVVGVKQKPRGGVTIDAQACLVQGQPQAP
jgi:7-cyano-7-deazaguanine reductase